MTKSYVVDAYLMYAASAFAANTMIRSGVAAAFPLFTTQMFKGVSQVTIFLSSVGLRDQTITVGHQLGGDAYCRFLPFALCSSIYFLQIRTADSLWEQIRSLHGGSGEFIVYVGKVLTLAQDLKIAKELVAEREKEREEV